MYNYTNPKLRAELQYFMTKFFQEDGIYFQRYSFYPKFEDKDKKLTCSLDEDVYGEENTPHDTVTISSVILFDASQCLHCTFDSNKEYTKGNYPTSILNILLVT